MSRGVALIVGVILAVVAVAVAVGTLAVTPPLAIHCTTPVKHGFTPMICTVPLPPGIQLKPSFPIPHPLIH